MTIQDNLRDLVRHAQDFERRIGFTYSVIVGEDVVGCVYIYPSSQAQGAIVRSWVREDKADLDQLVYRIVREWLESEWPFDHVEYDQRGWDWIQPFVSR